MYVFPELEKLMEALNEVNIMVIDEDHAGYHIQFDGTENEFVNALELMMMISDYHKQDEAWFPGDPGQMGEQDYYLKNDEVEFCISYDNKTLSNLV